MAGQSGDPFMIADYQAGDPHWGFGVRAGLVPPGANKADFQELRNKRLKPVTLGTNYGMSAYGIAAKTGKSLLWARDIHARHRRIYPVFHRWLSDIVVQAKFDRVMTTPFGWPVAVTGDTKVRTLMNYMAQGAGAECMRIVAIAATESGIQVCAPVHDAFWILAPLDEVDRTIEAMRGLMERAGAMVSGGLTITASMKFKILSPLNLGQTRGPNDHGSATWNEVHRLLAAGDLKRQTGA